MRAIQVDEAVFAFIWSKWKEGDRDENVVLRRIFGLPAAEPSPGSASAHSAAEAKGYTDRRTGTYFPPGFEIFRTFKGTPYRATVSEGLWRLADGRTAPTLNALSILIDATTENAWTGWHYKDKGEQKRISELRVKKSGL